MIGGITTTTISRNAITGRLKKAALTAYARSRPVQEGNGRKWGQNVSGIRKNEASGSSSKKRPAKKEPRAKKPAGPQLVVLEEQINAFVRYVDAEGAKWMLAVTNRGFYRTKDVDKGWELVPTPGLMAPFSAVSTVITDPTRTIYLGTSRGLATTTDFGATWTRLPIPSTASTP